MSLNIIKLLATLLFLGNKPLDIETVWDVVENIRPNSPDEFQVSRPSAVTVRHTNVREWRCCDRT